MRRLTWFSFILATLFSIAAVAMILQSIDLNQTINALLSSNLIWFGVAFVLQMSATGFTLLRWQSLLRPHPTRFFTLTQIIFAAQLLNTLLPAKLGTVARVLLAAEAHELNVGFSVGAIAMEKVSDTLVTLVLFLVIAPFVPFPIWLRDSLSASVAILLIGLIALATIRRMREPTLKLLERIETLIFARGTRPYIPRVASTALGFFESVENLTRRREIFAVLGWTLCLLLAGFARNQALFQALGLGISWSATLFVMIALQLGARLPSLPANLGVFHYLAVLSLTVYGVNESAALAFAILLHLIVFILPALIGAVCTFPLSSRIATLAMSSLRSD